MSNEPTPRPSLEELQARLHEVSRLLRQSRSYPDAREDLANLVDELNASLASGQVPSDHVTHLAETTAHLVETLHGRPEEGWFEAMRHRLEEAAVKAETQAPTTVGLVRQMLDILANMGI